MISAAAQGLVLSWWDRHGRDLPWRDTRDPWAVLIAEIMAQQTQVNRVVPRWHEFLERWPTPAVLAAASLADVLRAWQGLGYPRRAANLHRSAQVVVADPGLGGSLPDTLEGLLALPGIGPYTARAVLAFAHEADVGVVDTNTGRILARVGGRRLGARAAQVAADAWVPAGEGWAWNQAMLDVGALLCRPVPRCHDCPLATSCRWALDGWPNPDPAAKSAGVSVRQAPYRGSMREVRGRVLDVLAEGGATTDDVIASSVRALAPSAAHHAEPLDVRVVEALTQLEADGLVAVSASIVTLAGDPAVA
ncbi:A/G-specific adenine glycosylase [Candidatus Microthrix parvicella]|uniref:Adenine DNA glycosylase n=1 Tax=Candidatus Neomicrothrix parvicella RN1 TaxID=1229780 RepID=R4YYH7_9ACTN|nr:A/G-specific adenine glycosylase [Candidatus Microthrix parvicella]CCM63370.1 putative HhH-GPD family protein [Candidatus Microthrix parvicella RN1]